MNKLISGKTSLFVLTAAFFAASLLLGKSITSVFASNSVNMSNFTLDCDVTNKVFSGTASYEDGVQGNNYKLTFKLDDGPTITIWEDISNPNYFGGNWSAPNQTFGFGSHSAVATLWHQYNDDDWSATAVDTDPFTASSCEEEQIDACPLIDGEVDETLQDLVPSGYYKDEESGNCIKDESTPTPYDACFNLEGTQSGIPDGYHKDTEDGACNQYQLGGAPPPSDGAVLGASTGKVLGASTMAGTGSFAENLYIAIMGLGGLITAVGIKSFKKA